MADIADILEDVPIAQLRAYLQDLDARFTDVGHSTLQEALTAATGSSIRITRAWSLAAGVTVPARTRVIGWGGSVTCTVDGVNAIAIGGDEVSVENLRIVGPSSSAEPADITLGCGIYANGVSGFTVRACVISGFNACGMMARSCVAFEISGNRLYDNLYNEPRDVGDASDILIYSNVDGGKGIIEGNFCLSNNSQGIFVNALGHDSDIVIVGNVCVATDDGHTEATTIHRRHGIVAGYNQQPGGGRITVASNVVRGANSAGIYVGTNTNLHRAIAVIGNVISNTGMGTELEQVALNGGVTVNGGGASTIIANNAIYDFKGHPAASVGCITVNIELAGATCLIAGNSCDTSTAHGIVLKKYSTGVQLKDNVIRNSACCDIFEDPETGTGYGGHVIEGNDCVRANTNYPCIYIGFGTSTVTTVIRRNKFRGANTTTHSYNNGAVRIQASTPSKRVIVEDNIFSTFRYAVSLENVLTTNGGAARSFDLHRIDRNHFEDCYSAITANGATNAACMPVEGNSFRGVDNKSHTGGADFDCVYIARRENDRMVLLGLTAAPSVGTWIAGDRAEFIAPAAGAPPGAVCTTGGNAGTWKAMASLAL